MFPSQPQIGQDMARERQQQAAAIKAAMAAAADRPRRARFARLRGAMLTRRFTSLAARLRASVVN